MALSIGSRGPFTATMGGRVGAAGNLTALSNYGGETEVEGCDN